MKMDMEADELCYGYTTSREWPEFAGIGIFPKRRELDVGQ